MAHAIRSEPCRLRGEERTCRAVITASGFDPTETSVDICSWRDNFVHMSWAQRPARPKKYWETANDIKLDCDQCRGHLGIWRRNFGFPQQDEPSAGGELFEKVQAEFAQAYNRKDIAAMAAFFSENGVRITPAGVFRGREAIGRELQRVVVDLGLHDYSVKRTISRLEGNMVFNAGEWQAKLGDGQQFRGYYSALLVREGDGVKIFEETVNIAVP